MNINPNSLTPSTHTLPTDNLGADFVNCYNFMSQFIWRNLFVTASFRDNQFGMYL